MPNTLRAEKKKSHSMQSRILQHMGEIRSHEETSAEQNMSKLKKTVSCFELANDYRPDHAGDLLAKYLKSNPVFHKTSRATESVRSVCACALRSGTISFSPPLPRLPFSLPLPASLSLPLWPSDNRATHTSPPPTAKPLPLFC